MVGKLLVWGMLVGLAAGLLGFGVAKGLGEPQVDKAIAFEEYVEYHVHHAPPEADLVSRSLQSSAGLGTGAIVFGVAMGGIFALAFAVAYGRLGTLTARGTAAVLGLLAIVSLYIVPNLKYPANPPSVGDPDTISHRTALYLSMILISVVCIVIAVAVRNQLRFRMGDWNATIVCGLAYILAMWIAYVLLPGVNEVPQAAIKGVVGAITDARTTFPPTVLWRFRVASLAVQATVWGTIAIAFGYVATRKLEQAVPLETRERVDHGV
jgi:pimeloyl-ACP methyl ester carboxylesterase